MYLLGIETSCDETAAAVVKDGCEVLSNCVLTSLQEHSKFGGIIPEIASRRQLEYINTIVETSLTEANVQLDQIDAIAVTKEPGLAGSLLVGNSFAQSLGFATNKPVINVNHIQAHLYANFLKEEQPKLPAIGLVVSGGHTSLYLIKDFDNFELMGHTIDDAAGEAFDKVARILGLGYPGGPVIDKLANECKNTNIRFTAAQLPDTLNFSFSGIKTAVLYYHCDHQSDHDYSVNEVAKAFQNSVVSILVKKTIEAARKHHCQTILIGGGVAANSSLREHLNNSANESNMIVHFPPVKLCLDNAAMIAGLGYHQLKREKIHA